MAVNGNGKLRILLFGPFSVAVANREIPMEAWKSKKALVLFKYLVARCGERIPNDVLADFLWPDSDWESASHNLHTTVYFLRKTLKDFSAKRDVSAQIKFANGMYWFEPEEGDFLDTMEFRKLCRESENLEHTDPHQAIEAGRKGLDLYRGDFLGEDLYADWAASIREYYREQYMELALRTSRLLASHRKDYKQAIQICRVALSREPYREDLHQEVINYLIASHRYPEAAVQYQQCAKILQEEFGLDPCPQTQALLKKIYGNTPAEELAAASTSGGAFICDRSTFASILQLEKRRLERQQIPITVITILLQDDGSLDEQAKTVLQAVQTTLRKGDAACRWSNDRIAILLTAINEAGTGVVVRRLQRVLTGLGLRNFKFDRYVLTDADGDAVAALRVNLV